jgi:hypothetical protein
MSEGSMSDLYSDEDFRYGRDPELCPYCHESISGMCKFHRALENAKEAERTTDEIPADADGDEYKLSRAD